MPPRVLCVDDSPLVRVRAARMLDDHGLRVTALGSLTETRGVDASTFAAALLDLELGDGLGTDLAEHLRRAAPALPIAFLTAGGPTPLVEEARRMGPVFSKTGDVEAAIAWIVAAAG